MGKGPAGHESCCTRNQSSIMDSAPYQLMLERQNIQEITIQSSMIKLLFSPNVNGKWMVILSKYLEQCDQQQKAGTVHGPLGHQCSWRYMLPLIATLCMWTKLDYACMQPSVKLDQCSGELTEYSVLVISSALVVSEAEDF